MTKKAYFIFHGAGTIETMLDGGFIGVESTLPKAIERAKHVLVWHGSGRECRIVEADVSRILNYITDKPNIKSTVVRNKIKLRRI